MYNSDEYSNNAAYSSKTQTERENSNTSVSSSSYFLSLFQIGAIVCYLILLGSVFVRFIPIIEGTWLSLGMGKLILPASFISVFLAYKKHFFACFFISLFASFFVVHEIIIFYDNYAIELGRELTSEGLFRSVAVLFEDALKLKFGALWAFLGSIFSLIFITFSWIVDNFCTNYNAIVSEDNS